MFCFSWVFILSTNSFFLTFRLNFSCWNVSEKRALLSEYLMLFVYLIPHFTAALFVIRVICTSPLLLLLLFLHSPVSIWIETALYTLMLFECTREKKNHHLTIHYWESIQNEQKCCSQKAKRACFVPCHLHLVAIFDIFHGLPATFGITSYTKMLLPIAIR